MKKEVTKQIKVCDICKDENSVYYECENCHKDFCYGCKNLIEEFPAKWGFGTSNDLVICTHCLISPSKEMIPKIHAYQNLSTIGNEYKTMCINMDKRIEEAEQKIKKHLT